LKIHFTVNIETKEITAFEDAAYDSRENFNHLKARGISHRIKIRRRCSLRAIGAVTGRERRLS
jgi:IS5 family transposase